jgi:uncharacterized protein
MATPVFIGRDGLRAGWRLLLFVIVVAAALFSANRALRLLPGARAARQAAASGVLPPLPVLVSELAQALTVLAVIALFAAVERRPWRDYGLPWREVFGSRFWQGAFWGLAAISAELGVTALMGGFRIDGLSLGIGAIVEYGLLWAVVFLCVAVFEETLFRGYALQTAARGMGFLPAALLTSALFGAVHLQNSGEALLGVGEAALYGLLFCLTVYRTGTLWFAVGMHAAWDFGETFVYSVPDSGLRARGHLLNSDLHGPWWLSGASVGPEGSLVCLGILMALTVSFLWIGPRKSAA